MALKIRLARHGSKKRPYYHIVVADSRMPRDGRYIEKLGSYNPMLERDDEKRVQLIAERISHWIKVGAKPTDRVRRFLAEAKLYKPFKPNPQTKKHLPGKKAQERLEQLETAKNAPRAQETPEAPAEDAPAQETPEAPAEDAPAQETPEAPAEDAPAQETPEAPAEDAPAQETPEAPAEDAPAHEAPPAETPQEAAPADDAPAGDADTPDEAA